MIKNIVVLYFSPNGLTEKIANIISEQILCGIEDFASDELLVQTRDLFNDPLEEDLVFDDETFIIIAVPAVSGKVPLECVKIIQKLKGDQTLATVIVDHDNSGYGGALYELYLMMQERGFAIVSAGAFVVLHPLAKFIGREVSGFFDEEGAEVFGQVTATKLTKYMGTSISSLRAKPAPLPVRKKRYYRISLAKYVIHKNSEWFI